MILAQREMLEQKQSELTRAQSDAKVRALEIERLKLLLAKARREVASRKWLKLESGVISSL